LNASPARRPRARLAWAAAAALVAIVLMALGTWQVERRRWKLDLIDRIGQRVHAQAVAVPGPARWASINAQDDAYRHVALTGIWLADADTLVQASTELGAGFWVLTPLRSADGSLVLVNRGFVPPERRAASALGAASSPQPTTVTGLLRITEPGGGFLRRNEPAANRWYSRDVTAIAAARGLHGVAPYFIDADAAPAASPGAPVGGLTVVAFPNNHAVYAITWYTLALMTGWAAWRLLREPAPPASAPAGDQGARH
jgi:surfeit locus 1 family protein